jgi:hypothetical protein
MTCLPRAEAGGHDALVMASEIVISRPLIPVDHPSDVLLVIAAIDHAQDLGLGARRGKQRMSGGPQSATCLPHSMQDSFSTLTCPSGLHASLQCSAMLGVSCRLCVVWCTGRSHSPTRQMYTPSVSPWKGESGECMGERRCGFREGRGRATHPHPSTLNCARQHSCPHPSEPLPRPCIPPGWLGRR